MMPSSDSLSTITIESSSSRYRERKQFEQRLSELRSENASLSNTVKRLQNDLRVKEDEILEMQEVHEHQMLGMLKTKLSNTNVSATTSTSVSRHVKMMTLHHINQKCLNLRGARLRQTASKLKLQAG